MKNLILFTVFLVVGFFDNIAFGQLTNKEEASQIANNWIHIVIDTYGQWGDEKDAVVQPVREFKSNGRLIGYFCPVNPKGFIVISLRKELAPVKAYSDKFDLNPLDETGMTDLIKTCMIRLIDTIESRFGNIESINTSDLTGIVEIDYRQNWEYIKDYKPAMIRKNPSPADNYQEGDILTTSIWHQGPPYNMECPYMGCTTTSNGRALVGCVATAGAQIMKYWSWPPYGVGTGYNDTYDWPNMHDNVTTSSPLLEQAAVGELNHEIGVAVGMTYGCSASSANTWDMVGVYTNHYRYQSSCLTTFRILFSALTWFDQIKAQLNVNRPIQYRIPGHSIVCDGWQEIGSPVTRQYHMNYGWANGATTWYTLDALLGGNPSEEYMVLNIIPVHTLGSSLSGTYPAPSFPYRYFNLDASGSNATFNSGQLLQSLPGLTIKGTGTSTYIKFYGSSGLYTRIFTDGDQSEGIVIKGGTIRLRSSGSSKLY